MDPRYKLFRLIKVDCQDILSTDEYDTPSDDDNMVHPQPYKQSEYGNETEGETEGETEVNKEDINDINDINGINDMNDVNGIDYMGNDNQSINLSANQFMEFINSCPTTYHVTKYIEQLLIDHGFTYLNLKHDITIDEPGCYYTQRDDLTLVAFIVGNNWKPIHGSCFVASHIDALSVKINPGNSIANDIDGYKLLNVQPYSGSLNKLWLNRDLGLAGSILVNENGKISRKLINSPPIAFIPILAEHFGIEKSYNKQTEMSPIIGHDSTHPLPPPSDDEKKSPLFNRHSLPLLRYISQLSNTPLKHIIHLDLDLYDTQKSSQGGLNGEFIYSTSLDDRLCAYTSIIGLLQSQKKINLETYDGLIGCYLTNHEEIGSKSRTGAYSGLLKQIMISLVNMKSNKKITTMSTNNTTKNKMSNNTIISSDTNHSASESTNFNSIEKSFQLFSNSIILSSDVTHAFNPNFKNIYLENHLPLLNTGPVLKIDTNMHVLSDSLSYIFLKNLIDNYLPDLKLQTFHIRNDSRSGGTIGPILGTNINGAKIVVDVGIPILSMHSIRSICGYKDIAFGAKFYQTTFDHWSTVIKKMEGKQ
jgi:aminopeptidase I